MLMIRTIRHRSVYHLIEPELVEKLLLLPKVRSRPLSQHKSEPTAKAKFRHFRKYHLGISTLKSDRPISLWSFPTRVNGRFFCIIGPKKGSLALRCQFGCFGTAICDSAQIFCKRRSKNPSLKRPGRLVLFGAVSVVE